MLHHLSCCKWNTDSTIELQSLLRGNHVLMMIYTLYLCTILVSICHFSCAWQQQPLSLTSPTDASAKGRRSFFSDCSSVAASALLGSSAAGPLLAPGIAYAEDDEIIDVYFGCGCFWHVQHEFVEAEKTILGRADNKVSSRAGYAGGNEGMKDGKVCYHNFAQVSDYGKLGHAEVVSLRIPKSKFKDFAVEYCKLFKNGMRPDQLGDRGLEYRNLVGFKGGAKNTELAMQLVDASKETGDQLDFAVGKGTDRDIPRLVWIMDSEAYPSYVAEQYHQFHDGFNFGENYPNSYNDLAGKFSKAGEDFGSCPRV